MAPENNTTHIEKAVQAKIARGDVRMRSSLYFVVRTALIAGATFGVLVLSTFILNFILFSIHMNNNHALLGFGPKGWAAFLQLFPWALLALDLVLMLGIIALFRSFRLGYKTPALYLGIVAIFIIISTGTFIEQNGRTMNIRMMHEVRTRSSSLHTPPFVPRMFAFTNHDGFCLCEVTAIDATGTFSARDVRSEKERTFRLEESPYATVTGIHVGDTVFIAGNHDGDGDGDDSVRVFGMRKLEEDEQWVTFLK